MAKDYYVGLDIGTNSVGWAVTDEEYKLCKFKGNAMWGIRLFDESKTAEERRLFRGSRRRNQRKKERLQLLEMLFNNEISKIDRSFFQRFKESNLWVDDKTTGTKFTVFADADYTDKDFYRDYPTIYHLRKELIKNPQTHDPRLVFIALHHIIKNRGHFLFDELTVDGVRQFAPVYYDLDKYLYDNYEISLNCPDVDAFSKILKDKSLSKRSKADAICKLFGISKKDKENTQKYAVLTTLSGSTVALFDIFDDDELKADKKKVCLADDMSEKEAEYREILGERFELIEKLKAVYDWSVLADILGEEDYISYSKVDVYEQHNRDLKQLKEYVRKYFTKDEYNSIFSNQVSTADNYIAYSGHRRSNGKRIVVEKTCNQQAFCDFLKKKLGQCKDEKYTDMFARIENVTFMPKQVNKDNGVIPMQVHGQELEAILKNAEKYLPFLTEKDSEGLTVSDKIISIFNYRIPYYVGPLNNHSGKYWLVRKEGKIYPWNFESQVDSEASAERFIENLTSKCTYLPLEDVIPKNSLLYTKFMVLNELNNLKIDGNLIDISLKQEIYEDLFMRYGKVTNKRLTDYLKSRKIEFTTISGIDGDFKANLKPWIDLSKYNLSYDQKEDIIHAITVFGDDKKLLRKRIKEKYSKVLSEDEISAVSKLKYSDWSNLSKAFLTEIESVYKKSDTGELINIITALWVTNMNLQKIIFSEDFDFERLIKERAKSENAGSLKEAVDTLYVSPKVKRPIYQALLILKEIEKVQKRSPKKIFIEVAKGPETDPKKQGRTKSRKDKLVELYKTCGKEYDELYKKLLGTEDDKLKSDKLYLYYTQFGRCMYTNEIINLENLIGPNNNYDIDHIFPQSKIKDDSLENRVLVLKTANAEKGDRYPIVAETRQKMTSLWKTLLDKDMISQEKYNRLTRRTQLTDDELSAFISRQIVETRQSTKAVAKILEAMYAGKCEIVYVKAALASDFRKEHEMLKCREVNDLHHAKDAYLNIVVGNVYHIRFTRDKANFIQGLKEDGRKSPSMNAIFWYDTPGTWIAFGGEKSIDIVKRTMRKNNILYTQYSYCQKGGLFDQLILKKGKGQVPIKSNSPRADITKYGGYNKASSAFFSFVEYTDAKGKSIRGFVPVNNYQLALYEENPDEYVKTQLSDDKFVCKDVKIIVKCIKYGSCFSLDGFRINIAKKNGGTIGYKCGTQLVISGEQEAYAKKVINYLERNSNRPVNEFDKLSSEENVALFDTLLYKMQNTVYAVKFGAIGEKIKSHRDVFISLPIEKQCEVIRGILNMLHCNAVSGDLSLLGEAKSAGFITTAMKVSETKGLQSFKLVNQSITGLFETETELLDV